MTSGIDTPKRTRLGRISTAEPTQWDRVQKLLDRCVGSVLDVGGGDGWIAAELMKRGHEVVMLEVSAERCQRARDRGVNAFGIDAYEPFDLLEDYATGDYRQFDTVLLGEVLEHLDDPGQLLRDAFRIARERVIITVPLLGWADPTHQWRIRTWITSPTRIRGGAGLRAPNRS